MKKHITSVGADQISARVVHGIEPGGRKAVPQQHPVFEALPVVCEYARHASTSIVISESPGVPARVSLAVTV